MPQTKFRSVLLFGLPGVGKGTQGQRLGRLPHFLHLSSGEMFRALDRDLALGKQVRSFIERGELVPDDVTIGVFRNFVANLVASGRFDPAVDTLVLDGIPRNVNQCRILDCIRVVRIIFLSCSDPELMVARMRLRAEVEGRKDDANESVIRRRFEVYREETKPVLAYYPKELIAEIDALGTPDEVAAEIQKELFAK